MIRTKGLTREFRVKGTVVEAVKGIDLVVDEGEMVAFLGPNGAGKSTTLRMLTTLLAPTAGTAEVVGCDVVANPAAVRQRIGSIGQGNGAGQSQRVRDELVSQGRCYGLPKAEAVSRTDDLLEGFGLTELAGRVVKTLSGGQRRRLDVALGLVHRPELLFLDEPSTGLDPQNRANIAAHIERLHAEYGTTMVLTTHYLEEADRLADRVVIIDHGLIIADDSPERLRTSLVGDRLDLHVVNATDVTQVAAVIERLSGTMSVSVDGSAVQARVVGAPAVVPGLLRSLDDSGVEVASVEAIRATLDDVFLHLTGRSLREGTDDGASDEADTEGVAA